MSFEVVDITISSETAQVDAILEHPLLDGDKTYTVEVTELTAPLSGEPPLPREVMEVHDGFYLFRVRAKSHGSAPNAAGCDLRELLPEIVGNAQRIASRVALVNYQEFRESSKTSIRSVQDLVYEAQNHLSNIKAIITADHAALPVFLDIEDDAWAQVTMTPNNTIRFTLSPLFCDTCFIQLSAFSKKLFGVDESYISFTKINDVTVSALTVEVNGVQVVNRPNGSEPDGTCIQQGTFPLTRNFEHRVQLDLDSGGMPIPAVTTWTVSNKSAIRHTMASFPIQQVYETKVQIDSRGSVLADIETRCALLQGNVVFRRAEDKVTERYQITNSRFFQNIRLELLVERRIFDHVTSEWTFKRFPITLQKGDFWSCKLRFRTVK